jgi:hypothetical protein
MAKCKFYGTVALPTARALHGLDGSAVCALLPARKQCRMEAAGRTPDLELCELNESAAAVEIDAYTYIGESERK